MVEVRGNSSVPFPPQSVTINNVRSIDSSTRDQTLERANPMCWENSTHSVPFPWSKQEPCGPVFLSAVWKVQQSFPLDPWGEHQVSINSGPIRDPPLRVGSEHRLAYPGWWRAATGPAPLIHQAPVSSCSHTGPPGTHSTDDALTLVLVGHCYYELWWLATEGALSAVFIEIKLPARGQPSSCWPAKPDYYIFSASLTGSQWIVADFITAVWSVILTALWAVVKITTAKLEGTNGRNV